MFMLDTLKKMTLDVRSRREGIIYFYLLCSANIHV